MGLHCLSRLVSLKTWDHCGSFTICYNNTEMGSLPVSIKVYNLLLKITKF